MKMHVSLYRVTVIAFLLLGCQGLYAKAQIPARCHDRSLSNCAVDCPPPDTCPKNDETTHDSFLLKGEGHFCCPGYFLTKNNVCQICNDVTFMPGVNDCTCSCYECSDCEYPSISQCSRTSDTVCNVTNQTVIQLSSCNEHKESTSNPPTNETMTEHEDPEQPAESKKHTGSHLAVIGIGIVLGLVIFLIVSTLLFCCCYLRTLAAKEIPSDQTDGNETLRQALYPLARYFFKRKTESHGE